MKNFLSISLLVWIIAANYVWGQEIPGDHLSIRESFSYDQMTTLLDQVAEEKHITVSTAGKSFEGRNLYLVHASHQRTSSPWKIFFFAQQHGNEPAGKDALLYLLRYLADYPHLLPEKVELWIMPMVNPDGAERGQRRNANDYDLNRDHLVLSQPETQVLHRVYREIMPHVSVDCHEFTRDSRDYTDRGWLEWPLIMMDCANHPAFDPDLYAAGVSWCERVAAFMTEKGHNYTRYYVGGLLPEEELRYSTPEPDDARNGLGTYQGLSFIIESGIFREAQPPGSDLPQRVDAYLQLLTRFLYMDEFRETDRQIIEAARERSLPDFLPVNYFWGSKGLKITPVKVIDRRSGHTIAINTANFMTDMIVKRSVKTPGAYLVSGSHAGPFRELLDRHAIDYEILTKALIFNVQASRLVRVEDFRDTLYNRYAGRQIVEPDTTMEKTFGAGALYIPLNTPGGLRAALLLEPSKLYGLFTYDEFSRMIADDMRTPIWRVLKKP